MSISTEQIKELRQRTGAGVLACREALTEAEGDMERAMEVLRERGLALAAKRSDRETENGVIDLYNHGDGRIGVMVEVNCETDFVARTDEFQEFAHEIALQVAANSPRWITAEEVPDSELDARGEQFRVEARAEGKPEEVLDRIVDGRLQKFLQDNCLLLQPYIRDDSITVEELLQEKIVAIGENIMVRRFARWEVGEEL